MKCKLLRMSLLCLLFLFIFCINVSFASIDYSKFSEWNYNGSKIDLTNYLFNYFFDKDIITYRDALNQESSSALSSYDTFISRLNSNDYQAILWRDIKNTNFFNDTDLYITLSSNNSFSSTTLRYQFHKIKTSDNFAIVLASATGSMSVNGTLSNDAGRNKYLLTGSSWYIANNSPITPPNLITNLTFNSEKTNTIEVHFSGENENFIKADYSKSISSWRLGSFNNFDSSDVDTIYGYLASFQGSTSQAIYSEVIASFQWKKNIGTYSNGLSMPDTSEHAIYLSSSRIYYNQGYTLYFNAYKNGVEQEITNQFTYLYFVPLGDTSTSGELINPEATTNLDWDFINSTEHLYDYSSGNIEFLLNTNFSGDFSGDLFKQLGYVAPSDSEEHYGFIHNVFNSLIAVLIDTNTNVTLPIEVHGYQKTLYASDFTTPETPLKGFCRLFLIFGFIILFYQFLVKLYLMFLTLDLSGVLKQTQIDFTLFMQGGLYAFIQCF